MERDRVGRLLAAVVDLAELVDDALRHGRPDAAPAERMGDDQSLFVEYPAQSLPCRQGGIFRAHTAAQVAHYFFDFGEAGLITGGFAGRPGEVEFLAVVGESGGGLLPPHGNEKENLGEPLGFGGVTVLAGVARPLAEYLNYSVPDRS